MSKASILNEKITDIQFDAAVTISKLFTQLQLAEFEANTIDGKYIVTIGKNSNGGKSVEIKDEHGNTFNHFTVGVETLINILESLEGLVI